MILSVWDQSELALGSYALLLTPGRTDDPENLRKLREAGMSQRQAEEFALRYPTVVAQINDTATSFSATVFAAADGQLHLAIRGTADAGDFVPTDANIAVNGAGYDQIAALYNTWQRLTHRQGETITVYRVDLTDPLNPLVAESIVNDLGSPSAPLISPGAAVDVTGHSLGGHLAMAFAGLFPINARQVLAFNAPGFIDSPQNRNFFAQLGGALPTGAAPSGVPTINVIADGASGADVSWRGIAGLHSRPGNPIDIAIENQATGDEPIVTRPGALNHSQIVLTDALAVYALLARLDPALNPASYERLLSAAATGTAASLERTVDALQRQLNNDGALLPVGNGAVSRDALYQAIYGLRADGSFSALAGKVALGPVTAADAGSLANTARTDFGALIALKTLSPFTLKPQARVADAQAALEAVWLGAHGSDYAAWQSDLALTADQRAAGLGHFTDRYLQDRAELLAAVLKANTADTTTIGLDQRLSPWQVEYRYFEAGDTTPRVIHALPLGQTTPTTLPKRMAAFGSDFGDQGEFAIAGGAERDRLYGMAGDDELRGEAGDDELRGNSWFDAYALADDFGQDVLLDADEEDRGHRTVMECLVMEYLLSPVLRVSSRAGGEG